MSASGSPIVAISQSSTAISRAGAPSANIVLPSRKSPCTIVASGDSGMLAASQSPTSWTSGSSRVLLISQSPLKRRSWRSR